MLEKIKLQFAQCTLFLLNTYTLAFPQQRINLTIFCNRSLGKEPLNISDN